MMLTNVTKTVGAMMAASHISILLAGTAFAQNVDNDVRAALDSEEYPATVNVVPVTVNDFATAETHYMMATAVEWMDALGQWSHSRGFTPMDRQNVVRMNRDTLYSTLVLDLSTPAVLTKADVGDRYQSILVLNEEHFAQNVFYEPGEYTLTQEDMGSRYVAVIARTLVDAEDPEDLFLAHAAQDGLKVIQADIGQLELPNWDQAALEEMRDALKVLGKYLPSRDQSYGASIEEVDPVAYLIGASDAWGGWHPSNATYLTFFPSMNDGDTAHVLTLNDVPSGPGAFWSISVYDKEGYFQENAFDKYVINSLKAETAEDGSVTIHFGGDPSQPNFLPIMEDWNYILRIYLPQDSYFDGSWTTPEAQPVD